MAEGRSEVDNDEAMLRRESERLNRRLQSWEKELERRTKRGD